MNNFIAVFMDDDAKFYFELYVNKSRILVSEKKYSNLSTAKKKADFLRSVLEFGIFNLVLHGLSQISIVPVGKFPIARLYGASSVSGPIHLKKILDEFTGKVPLPIIDLSKASNEEIRVKTTPTEFSTDKDREAYIEELESLILSLEAKLIARKGVIDRQKKVIHAFKQGRKIKKKR